MKFPGGVRCAAIRFPHTLVTDLVALAFMHEVPGLNSNYIVNIFVAEFAQHRDVGINYGAFGMHEYRIGNEVEELAVFGLALGECGEIDAPGL